MTDKEIIKALECHASDAEVRKLCPLTNEELCSVELARNTLDIINRQQAEIDKWRYNLECVLKERADHSEAIKEFAERLDRKFAFYYSDTQCISAKTIRESIRNELKEMVGEG